jgi:UDP-3-O-[3-hydroxymyristoyl] glucosamine N-acyltransferase
MPLKQQGGSGMGEPIFLTRGPGLTLDEIAALVGAAPPTASARDRRIATVAPLDTAGPSDLTFLDKPRFTDAAAKTQAGACLATAALARHLPQAVAVLVVAEPFPAFVAVARRLFPAALRPSSLYEAGGIVGAHVHPQARLEDDITIDPGAVIGPRAEIGSGTIIGAGAVIGAEVRVGRNCSIGAGAVISHALIGDRVIIHPGCKIGQDGFGFVMSGKGHLKIPQIGRVIIQDDVEIGAGSTIDRGAIRDTVIGEGTKIDNLVQIGHNVSIGRHCVLVAQTGIAGSATVEDFVVLGARVGLNNHVTIGEGAQVAAISAVHGDIPVGERWGGAPAKPMKVWISEMKALTRLARKAAEGKTAESE